MEWVGTNNIAAFFRQACFSEIVSRVLFWCYCWRTSFKFFDKVVGNVLQVVLVGAEFIAESTELGQQVLGNLSWETWGVWESLKGLHRRIDQ